MTFTLSWYHVVVYDRLRNDFNTLRSGDAYWIQETGSSLLRVMARRQIDAHLLSKFCFKKINLGMASAKFVWKSYPEVVEFTEFASHLA